MRSLKIFTLLFSTFVFNFKTYSMEKKFQIFDLSNQRLTSENLETEPLKTELKKLATDKLIKTIDLSGNNITDIPKYLLQLPQQLILDKNPVADELNKSQDLKRGSITEEIAQTQKTIEQMSNFFSSRTTENDKYKLIKLNNTVIIVAPGSNINYKEIELNPETKLVFITPKKAPAQSSWFMKYIVGGAVIAVVVGTKFLAGAQVLEFIQTLLCACN